MTDGGREPGPNRESGEDDWLPPDPDGYPPVPPDVAARTRVLIEAELRAMQKMTWRATAVVMFTSSAVLIPGMADPSNLTLPVLVGVTGLCAGYALAVRGIAHG